MFQGTYEYRVDAKGRKPLPPRFREKLKHGVVLCRGLEKCINVHPVSEWEKEAESSSTLPPSRSKERRMNRIKYATAFSLEPDAQGRIALPNLLRQHAEIGENVVIVGANMYAEIWSEKNWIDECDLMESAGWQISESMGDHN